MGGTKLISDKKKSSRIYTPMSGMKAKRTIWGDDI